MTSQPRKTGASGELLHHFQDWSDRKFAAWLLHGFAEGDFSPLVMPPEPSAALQIHQIFCAAKPVLQRSLKSGLARAILEWSSSAYDYEVLAELARTAAHVRASESVTVLSRHIQSSAFRAPRSEAAQKARDTLVAVLKGFVPLDELYPILLSLYAAEDFREYGAQLFLSLCQYSPRQFFEHVPRFLEVIRRGGDEDMRLDLVIEDFVQIVPQPLIEEALPTLLSHPLQKFVDLLTEHSNIALGTGVSFEMADSEHWFDQEEPHTSQFPMPRTRVSVNALKVKEQQLLFESLHRSVSGKGVRHVVGEAAIRLHPSDPNELPY